MEDLKIFLNFYKIKKMYVVVIFGDFFIQSQFFQLEMQFFYGIDYGGAFLVPWWFGLGHPVLKLINRRSIFSI